MATKHVMFLLLLVVAIASACDFDILVDTLYDDDGSSEDEVPTPKPSNSPQAPSGGGSNTTPKPTTPLAAQTTPLSAPQASSAAPSSASREAKARRHRKKRKHLIGRISPGKPEVRNSKLYEHVDPLVNRYAPSYSEIQDTDKVVESGRNLQNVFDDNKDEDNDEESHRSLRLDSFFGLSRSNDDNLDVAETGRSSNSHQEVLLKLLMAEMEENAKLRKLKLKQVKKQKEKRIEANKKAFDVFLKLLESNLKHEHGDKKEDASVTQQVLIFTSGNKDKKKTFKNEIKCEVDENDYVTCVKDQTIYETMKLNPKHHSGMHKMEENIHYHSNKDNDSVDKVFNSRHPYDQSHPYPHPDRPHYSHPYDDNYKHPQHPYMDTSNRFNQEDNSKPEDKVEDKMPKKEKEMSSTGAIESSSSMSITEKL